MNNGCAASGNEIFLVRCTDCRCLAVRTADESWRSFYDGASLPDVIEPIASIPFELILPFLPGIKHERLCPTRACSKNKF